MEINIPFSRNQVPVPCSIIIIYMKVMSPNSLNPFIRFAISHTVAVPDVNTAGYLRRIKIFHQLSKSNRCLVIDILQENSYSATLNLLQKSIPKKYITIQPQIIILSITCIRIIE